MSSILSFLKKFFISSSFDEAVSKYVKLLDDSHVNQLNFPISDKKYQFNLRDLQREKVIYGNGNAMVVHYTFRPLNFSLVVKTLLIPIDQRKVNEERLKTLIEEVNIVRKISHSPNVTDFYGYAIDEGKIWICMELMEASLEDLHRYFHEKLYPELRFSKKIVIPETVVSVIAVSILDALAFCKKQRVMHRDVKPRHVLVNKNGEVKLCGFGYAKILESGSMASSFKGTLQYLPPERFEDDQSFYDERTDVWSLGITLVEIAYGDSPYNVKGLRPNEDYFKIMNIIKNTNDDEIMSRCFGEDYSDDLRYFVKSCLKELSSRPRYPQLMETNLYKSFVANDDNENIMGPFMEIYLESLKIEKNPDDPYAYYSRGDLQKALGNYKEAIADYTKLIELMPTDTYAYCIRGDLQKELENYNEAIADYTKAIELNPLDLDAYKNRGFIQNKLGKYNEAIADYTKAIDLIPTQKSTSSLKRANSKTSFLLSQKEEQETNPSKPKEFSHDSVTSDRYIYDVFDNVHLIKFSIPTQHYLLTDHFTCKETLFSGNHVVQKFVHTQTKIQVAIKFINIPKDCTATGEIKEKLQKLKNEIDILQALFPSKLVTELYGYSIHNQQLLIYMECMDMSLHELYELAHKKLSSFPEVLLDLVAINGLDALIYLKFKKIMHRDVKPKNILVNKSGQIKLCDFGTSKLLNNSFATTWTGTVAYLPPEAFTGDNEKFDVRREVWALGLTIAEVAFGKYPIGEGKSTDQYYILKYIKNATSEEIIRKSMQNFDDDIKEFAGLCLQELKNRPKYESLKEKQLYKKYLEHDRIQLFKETLKNFKLF